MTGDEYIELARTTASKESDNLTHYALGVCTEAGELAHEAKAHIAYGKDLDRTAVLEELGDLCWYMGNLLHLLDASWEDIWGRNIDKLKARYPEGFDKARALKRDLDAEREALEG